MKTKRRATRLQLSQSQVTTPPTPTPTLAALATYENPPLDMHITCSLLTTNTVVPHSSSKKTRFDNVVVRRSQRIQNSYQHYPLIRDSEPVIHDLDPIGSEPENLQNSAQPCAQPGINQSRIRNIKPAPQNQIPADTEKESEDGDDSEANSFELEPDEQPINEISKGSKNKPEMRYRLLYVESHKKLEELTHVNNNLSKRLAVAEGKLEVYEKGSGILTSILDKTKDVFMAAATLSTTPSRAKPTRKTITPKRKKALARVR